MSQRVSYPGKGGGIAGLSLLFLVIHNALNPFRFDPGSLPFLGNIALLLLMLAGIGLATNGYWLGVVIDNRNRVSLSKLQAVVWTVLVMAAYATTASMRLLWC